MSASLSVGIIWTVLFSAMAQTGGQRIQGSNGSDADRRQRLISEAAEANDKRQREYEAKVDKLKIKHAAVLEKYRTDLEEFETKKKSYAEEKREFDANSKYRVAFVIYQDALKANGDQQEKSLLSVEKRVKEIIEKFAGTKASKRAKQFLASGKMAPPENLVSPVMPIMPSSPSPLELPAPPRLITPDFSRVRIDNIELSVSNIRVGIVTLDFNQFSARPALMLDLTIKNTAEKLITRYTAWTQTIQRIDKRSASLKDSVGNTYRLTKFGLSRPLGQLDRTESIYPGKTIKDLIIFEIPIDNAGEMTLTLPADAFGLQGEFIFRFDSASINRK